MVNDNDDLILGPEATINAIADGKVSEVGGAKSASELESIIRQADISSESKGYDEAGYTIARIILEYLEQHPEDSSAPLENEYDYDAWEVNMMNNDKPLALSEYIIIPGLRSLIRQKDSSRYKLLSSIGPSDFIWGWAFNAIRYILGLPPVPNSAILLLDTPPPTR